MGEDKIKIPELVSAPQKIDTPTAKTRFCRRILPTGNDGVRLRMSGCVAHAYEVSGDPCAADLVFLAKFSFATCADDGDSRMAAGEILGKDRTIAKTSQIHRLITTGFMDDLGTRG